jgi:hypothetical protein
MAPLDARWPVLQLGVRLNDTVSQGTGINSDLRTRLFPPNDTSSDAA